MKKIIVFFLILWSLNSVAQNLQLHYDFGEDRKYLTATIEMFRPDTLGSTFFFTDFDFNMPGKPRSISAVYGEFSREFYIPGLRKKPFFDQLAFHLEYDDGFTAFKVAEDTLGAASYNSVFLLGFSHPLTIGKFVINTQWLCRLPRGTQSPDFQFTVVWFQPLFKGKLLLTGYADLWSQDKITESGAKELVFQTEPQFWYLFTPKIALGSEIEISKNFPVGPHKWSFSPTLGFRWEF
jgi:hypothetical protein